MMWGYEYGPMMGYGGFGLVHLLFSAFWIIVIAALALLIIRWMRGGSAWHPHTENAALEILRERYAKGEIGKEEFEEKKKDLGA